MQEHTSLAAQYYESFEMLEQLVQKGNQLHDQAIFDFGARLVSGTARLLRKAAGKGYKPYRHAITIKDSL